MCGEDKHALGPDRMQPMLQTCGTKRGYLTALHHVSALETIDLDPLQDFCWASPQCIQLPGLRQMQKKP